LSIPSSDRLFWKLYQERRLCSKAQIKIAKWLHSLSPAGRAAILCVLAFIATLSIILISRLLVLITFALFAPFFYSKIASEDSEDASFAEVFYSEKKYIEVKAEEEKVVEEEESLPSYEPVVPK
jgi:hypothetical protein